MDSLSLVTGSLFVFASIFGVLALSVDRFLAVHLHLRYQEIVTPKRVVSILILIWVTSATLSLLGIAKHYNSVPLIFQSILLAASLVTIALLQCKIYFVVRRHRYQIRAQQAQGSEENDSSTSATFERLKLSIHSAFLTYVLLLICYLPHLFTNFAFIKSKEKIVHRYTATLLFFNSCLNPLIYCWKFRHIRPTIRMVLRNIFLSGAQLYEEE